MMKALRIEKIVLQLQEREENSKGWNPMRNEYVYFSRLMISFLSSSDSSKRKSASILAGLAYGDPRKFSNARTQ